MAASLSAARTPWWPAPETMADAYAKVKRGGLKLKGGMTLLDIAQSNKKQAAAGALLP